MNIVTVSPTRLGDTLFCTPAYRHIKQMRPQAHLTVIAMSVTARDVLRGNPYIDQLLFEPDEPQLGLLAPDLVLHLHHLAGAETYLEKLGCAPHRLGHQNDALHCAEQTARFVADVVGGVPDGAGYDLVATAAEVERVDRLFQGISADALLLGLHLGCHGLHKKRRSFWRRKTHAKAWPVARYVEFARLVRDSFHKQLDAQHRDVHFVVTGSGAERELARDFCGNVPEAMDLTDQTSVGELAALMSRLSMFVCGDTGPMHVACAADVPLLGLYGSTELHRTGPFPAAPQRRVLRGVDLHELGADVVAASAIEMLGRS